MSDPDHYQEVLQKLLQFYHSDVCKFYEVSQKLSQSQLDRKDLEGAVETLQQQAEKCREDVEKYQDSLASLIKTLTQQTSLSDELTSVLVDVLEKAVSDNQTPSNMENLKHLIKLYYKVKDISSLVKTAVRMTALFPENVYPLEWICKVYLESTAGIWQLEKDDLLVNLETFIAALRTFSPNSCLASLAEGALHYQQGRYEDSVAALRSGCDPANPNIYGLYLQCRSHRELRDHSSLETTAGQALELTNKIKNTMRRQEVQQFLSLSLLQALYDQLSLEKIRRARAVLERCEEVPLKDFYLVSAKIFATLGESEKAREIVENKSGDFSDQEKCLVNALLSKAAGDTGEFVLRLRSILSEDKENFEVLVLLGVALYNEEKVSECLPLLLRAAKVNSAHWLPFLYLGLVYEAQAGAGLEKARKCYQKSLQLSGESSEEAALRLSDIYRRTGRSEENLALLTRVTAERGGRGAVWAWLRLGVHYLDCDQAGQAVTSLQAALRSDPANLTCWEALADAYMARGSFVAARKAFEKVVSLEGDQVYSRLMIADIKQRLGHHQEAVVDYQLLLTTEPDYLPALRGLGETYLALAAQYLSQFVDGNVLDSVAAGLAVLTRAAQVRSDLAGTWRLLGETCGLLGPLSQTSRVVVPGLLVGGEEGGQEVLTRQEVLELGVRCYTRALVLDPASPATWHDLALLQAGLGQLEAAAASLRKCLSLEGGEAQYWLSLGVVEARREDWARAQHSFVKSLQLENSAVCWTNLGVLYLNLGEHGLANKAFKEAQNAEPDYIRGWTGQGLLAEITGVTSECMDIFRHCTFLGPEPESARAYSDWVCSSLASLVRGEKVEPHNKYILDKMHGVTVAVDSLTAYTRRFPQDVTALVELGVLYEKVGLARSAREVTAAALAQETQPERREKILANLGRILLRLERWEEAAACFTSITSHSLYSQLGLAMAHYKLCDYQASYQAYESCLHQLADSDGLKSHILVAMGSLAYKVEGMPAAKTLLFQSCQLSPPSVRGLFALCVIGVQHSDMNLIEAALSEMVPHEKDPRFAADIAFLRASILVLKGDVQAAKRSLLHFLHRQPWLAKLWSHLALFLLQNSPKDAKFAARVSSKAGVMRQGEEGCEGEERVMMESLVTGVVALMMAGDGAGSLKRASQACHQFPHLADSWALLLAAARLGSSPAPAWLARVAGRVVERAGHDNQPLTKWALRVADTL